MKSVSQIAEEVSCRLHRGKGRESDTFNIATVKQTKVRHFPTQTNPKDLNFSHQTRLSRAVVLKLGVLTPMGSQDHFWELPGGCEKK